jgi:hypothetical protein
MPAADEVVLPAVVRVIANGTAIDPINNIAKANPPRNEGRQGQLLDNDHATFLLLNIITFHVLKEKVNDLPTFILIIFGINFRSNWRWRGYE